MAWDFRGIKFRCIVRFLNFSQSGFETIGSSILSSI